MIKAFAPLLKFIIILIAILIGIGYFSDTEISTSTKQDNKLINQKDKEVTNYYLDLYEESIKPSFILPKNAYVHNKAWFCNPAYVRVGDICKLKSTQGSSYSKSKQDKWWEKTDKYAICYGNVTAAHKANGLHTRNRDKSIEIKKQLCKIAATSTTGEGSFWLK